MIVRPATPADRGAVIAMASRFIEETAYRAWPATEEHLGELFDLAHVHGVIFLAEDQGWILGMLAIVVVPHLLTERLYAEELCWWVNPAVRGGLAAPRLLEAAEQFTRQRGLSCLKMVQPADQPTVGRLYSRRGFRPVEVAFVKEW